jgi:short-subunit dehydrogenase
MRNKFIQNNLPIYVTDILPGWVDTEQKKFSEVPGTYWVIPAEQAARDIVDAIKNKEKVRYVAKRQQLVAWALAICPDALYNWMGGL